MRIAIKAHYKELLFASPNFAWAAANLAIGTLGPEQETYVNPSSWQNRIESGSPPCSPQIPIFRMGFVFRPHSTANLISLPTPFVSNISNGLSCRIFFSAYNGRNLFSASSLEKENVAWVRSFVPKEKKFCFFRKFICFHASSYHFYHRSEFEHAV